MLQQDRPDNAQATSPAAAVKNCALCAFSGAGGLLLGHAGCIIAPLAMAALGACGVAAGMSLIAIATGAAITGLAIFIWYYLRGRKAGAWERRFVVGSAVAGLAVSALLHLGMGQMGMMGVMGIDAADNPGRINALISDPLICRAPRKVKATVPPAAQAQQTSAPVQKP